MPPPVEIDASAWTDDETDSARPKSPDRGLVETYAEFLAEDPIAPTPFLAGLSSGVTMSYIVWRPDA